MTAATTVIGLIPILWSTDSGADVMPDGGGTLSAKILTLLLYGLFREWGLKS